MGLMLDTSALIGLHEADPEVVSYLAGVLEHNDDGTVPRTHQVVLGELWTGVLAVGEANDPGNPRRSVLDTAAGLDIETIEDEDAGVYMTKGPMVALHSAGPSSPNEIRPPPAL
jgi:hypothetical protein